MERLTFNDKRWRGITYGKSTWRPFRVVVSSGEGCNYMNTLTVYAFGYVAQLNLGRKLLRPPCGQSSHLYAHDYGFSVYNGAITVYYGRQTMSSDTDKSWYYEFPWTTWRHTTSHIIGPSGTVVDVSKVSVFDISGIRDTIPSDDFWIQDYDGQLIKASCHCEYDEYARGRGLFKWLGWFSKIKKRTLRVEFSSEVGPEKGSWKGGLMGTTILMVPTDTAEDAIKRYCESELVEKGRKYRLTYRGRIFK